jgi:hypothetical protein
MIGTHDDRGSYVGPGIILLCTYVGKISKTNFTPCEIPHTK